VLFVAGSALSCAAHQGAGIASGEAYALARCYGSGQCCDSRQRCAHLHLVWASAASCVACRQWFASCDV
jgi:hypothetical protein